MNHKKLKLFFSGIGGSGVSAIAGFMSDKGHQISGSDRAFDKNPEHFLKKAFQARGITIVPQDGIGLDKTVDLIIFSTAIEPDKPEVLRAKELGLDIMTRPQYLSDITSRFNTIAVSGTSGKSTTSGMLTFVMERLGMGPNFIGGGRVTQFKSENSPGNFLTGDSDHLVIEACESDGTIINYRPSHTVILNISLDHHSVDKTLEMFKTLMVNTKDKVIVNGDDNKLMDISGKDIITFSIDRPSPYRAEDIKYDPFSTKFSIRGTPMSLPLPGKHNLYNALASIAILSEMGVELENIKPALNEFRGIDRRFDIHLNDGVHLVIDDYAHNPHKIESLMNTIKNIGEDVCYIYQPHGFGPTRLMKNEYIKTFSEGLRDTDHLVLLPIYYAGGTISKDISSHDLGKGIKNRGHSVEVIEDRNDVLTSIHRFKTVIVFGARDETLSDLAKEIAQQFVISNS